MREVNYRMDHVSSTLNQCRQMAQQILQQTQQSSAQYQHMLQQEMQNAQWLEQLAQRERQAVQIIQQALQGHQTVVQQLQGITQMCSQLDAEIRSAMQTMWMAQTPPSLGGTTTGLQ